MTKQKRNLMASALPVLALCLSTAACSPGSNHETNPYVGSVRADSTDAPEQIIEKAAHLVPTPRQLAAMENEFIAFIHFGPNTFTQREWGTGLEDPRVFDLKELHTDDWCRDMKEAGMKMVILTVKHHDGFCLWQTRYTRHGIMSTGYQEGKGDVLKELAASCQKYGLKLGIYLSPADLFQIESPEGLYGNGSQTSLRTIPREVADRPFENKTTFQFEVDDYNEYFLNQLFELLTEYGPVHEVWFDGAHPKRKGGQTYNYTAWRTLIRTLAPQATIFGREDVRWCGNEGGATRPAEFNVITYPEDPATMTEFNDIYGEPGTRQAYAEQQKPFYLHYEPAETNTSIRAGWFFSDDTYQEVRTADDVFDIYERSVAATPSSCSTYRPHAKANSRSATHRCCAKPAAASVRRMARDATCCKEPKVPRNCSTALRTPTKRYKRSSYVLPSRLPSTALPCANRWDKWANASNVTP